MHIYHQPQHITCNLSPFKHTLTHTLRGQFMLVEEGKWGHRGLGLKVKDNESAKTPSQGNIIHNWGRGPGHFSTMGPQTWLWVQTPRLLCINMGTKHRWLFASLFWQLEMGSAPPHLSIQSYSWEGYSCPKPRCWIKDTWNIRKGWTWGWGKWEEVKGKGWLSPNHGDSENLIFAEFTTLLPCSS